MSLSDRDFGLLQQSIDAIMAKIASLNLSLVIESDFQKLQDYLEEHSPSINPTFNPAYNDLTKNGFWFRVIDDRGTTVACHADRIFLVNDFCDLLETGELWFDGGFRNRSLGRLPIIRPPTRIGGAVSHSGSLWVDPSYRGKGLSLYLPYLSRSLLLRNYETEFHTGVVFRSLAGSQVPTANYGYPHVEICIDGYFPPTGREEQIYLCYVSQAESLQILRRLPWHPMFPVAFGDGLDLEIVEGPVVDADQEHVHPPAIVRQR